MFFVTNHFTKYLRLGCGTAVHNGIFFYNMKVIYSLYFAGDSSITTKQKKQFFLALLRFITLFCLNSNVNFKIKSRLHTQEKFLTLNM